MMMSMASGFPPTDATQIGLPAQRTSRMAITALVCSAILCCPITTLLGILLGLVAFARIRGNPALRGSAVAVAAILVGILATVGQWRAFTLVKDNIFGPMMTGPRDALTAGFGGDIAAFKSSFYGAGAAVSDEDAAAFLDELSRRYGTFVDSRYNQQTQPQGGSIMEFDYVLQFESDSVPAKVQIIYADETAGDWVKKLGFILVVDPDHEELVYPPGLDHAAVRGRVP